MSKIKIFLILLILILWSSIVYGQTFTDSALGTSTTVGQIACLNGPTPTLLQGATSGSIASPLGRLSITFEVISIAAGNGVYIGTTPLVSTTNGLLLSTVGQSITLDRTSGSVSWYCVGDGGTVTVAVLEEK